MKTVKTIKNFFRKVWGTLCLIPVLALTAYADDPTTPGSDFANSTFATGTAHWNWYYRWWPGRRLLPGSPSFCGRNRRKDVEESSDYRRCLWCGRWCGRWHYRLDFQLLYLTKKEVSSNAV